MNYFLRHQEQELERCEGMIHEIRPKDTLYRISKQYGISVNELLEKNAMVDVYNLQIGDKLCIPVNYIPYITKQGDTLDDLLKQFQMTYDMFRKANPQLTPYVFDENTVIYIPEEAGAYQQCRTSAG